MKDLGIAEAGVGIDPWRTWGGGATMLLGIALSLIAGSAAGQELRPCADEPLEGRALCGQIEVPEDYDDPDGRTISLNVVVIPASSQEVAEDPVFFLSGGPGQGSTAIARFAVNSERTPERNRRDLVLVDQRGTGASNSLACPPEPTPAHHFGRVLASEPVLRACLEEVSERADPRLYTTTVSARDLDEVRRRLGYGRINLSGSSYGTRLALEYARRYPEGVRTLTIQGVAPVDFKAPLFYARYAQEALDALFVDCAQDPDCSEAYPELERAWAEVLERLEDEPVVVRVSADNGPAEVTYSKDDLAYTVRSMLYGPDGLSIPLLIDRAWRTGDFSELAQLYLDRSVRLEALAGGLHLAVFCAEDVRYITDAEVDRVTGGTYLGSYLVEEYRRACSDWPRGDIPADFHDPVRSDAPTLILSGRRDPSTPPATGEWVRPHLPNAVHLVHPWGGHGFPGTEDASCEERARETLLRTASVEEIDVSCAAEEEPMPFRLPESGDPIGNGSVEVPGDDPRAPGSNGAPAAGPG